MQLLSPGLSPCGAHTTGRAVAQSPEGHDGPHPHPTHAMTRLGAGAPHLALQTPDKTNFRAPLRYARYRFSGARDGAEHIFAARAPRKITRNLDHASRRIGTVPHFLKSLPHQYQ